MAAAFSEWLPRKRMGAGALLCVAHALGLGPGETTYLDDGIPL